MRLFVFRGIIDIKSKNYIMKKTLTSTITIPCDPAYIPIVRGYIDGVARKMGFGDEDAHGIVLAVGEAATNVVKHAFLPEENATFDVISQESTVSLKVIIRDKGIPFSPDQVEKFSIDKVTAGGAPKGLGFFLMEKSVDKFSFHNLGTGGKEIHLTKFIHKKRIEDYVDESELTAYEEPKAPGVQPIKKVPYSVKPINPSQAIEICQCAYRTYGYNYIFENIYYPDRIVEMNKKGELISLVAVSDDTHEVMSHAALEMDEDRGLTELGVAFTKPEFRNQGCFKKLTEGLIKKAERDGKEGIYGRAVTAHPYSQKGIIKNGFNACGIMLALAPAALFHKAEDADAQKESLVVLYRNIGIKSAERLYAPKAHKAMLGKIYKNIKVPAEWRDTKGITKDTLTGKTPAIDTTIVPSLSNARISIKQFGAGMQDMVARNLKDLCVKKIDTIHLLLDLKDPYTALVTKDLEKIGFFFCGVLPSASRHNLILQYLNNIPIQYEKIQTASDVAGEMLSYIRQKDEITT